MQELKVELVVDLKLQLMTFQNYSINTIHNIKMVILINQNFQDFVSYPTLLYINILKL